MNLTGFPWKELNQLVLPNFIWSILAPWEQMDNDFGNIHQGKREGGCLFTESSCKISLDSTSGKQMGRKAHAPLIEALVGEIHTILESVAEGAPFLEQLTSTMKTGQQDKSTVNKSTTQPTTHRWDQQKQKQDQDPVAKDKLRRSKQMSPGNQERLESGESGRWSPWVLPMNRAHEIRGADRAS